RSGLVLERQRNLGPEGDDLAAFDLHVELVDFCDTQVAQRPGGGLHGPSCSFLPRGRARADDLRDAIDAGFGFLLGHVVTPAVEIREGLSPRRAIIGLARRAEPLFRLAATHPQCRHFSSTMSPVGKVMRKSGQPSLSCSSLSVWLAGATGAGSRNLFWPQVSVWM